MFEGHRWRIKGLSLTQRRIWVGVAGVPALLSVANYYGGWVGQAPWPQRFVAVAFLLVWAVLTFVGPTIDELRAYRDSKRASQ